MRFTLLLASFLALVRCDGDPSLDLLSQARSILHEIPQFKYNHIRAHKDDSTTVITIPMDYDQELEDLRTKFRESNLSQDQKLAYELLEQSAELGNVDAVFTLADINMYGNWSYPQSAEKALQYYHHVIELEANATAYFNLGFLYATGLFGQLELNQAKANLFFEFAHHCGDIRATIALGYRNSIGGGMPLDWQQAAFYYQQAVNTLKEKVWEADDAPLGGIHLDSFNMRIADWNEGVYGKDVGDMESSLSRKPRRFDSIINTSWDEQSPNIVFYYYNALDAYEGSYMKKRDFKRTLYYGKKCVEEAESLSYLLSPIENTLTAKCLYLLGRMNMRGEGAPVNFTAAIDYYQRSIERVDSNSGVYGDLGLIFQHGPEGIQNITKAGEMFNKTIQSEISERTYFHLLYLKEHGSPNELKACYERLSKTVLGYLPAIPEIMEGEKEMDILKSPQKMTRYLKAYVEQFDPCITSLEWAFAELLEGRTENALIGYAMAAEQGFEAAQASAAFLLYSLEGMLEEPPITTKERKHLAMVYITRSCMLGNLDSAVWLGDMYYEAENYDNAMQLYEVASAMGSSQATFNLGWLHEMGLGVETDFYLAKRNYDLSLQLSPKAYLPAQITLLRLRCKGILNKIWSLTSSRSNGGKGGSKKRSWSDWKELYKKVRGQDHDNRREAHEDNEEAQIDFEYAGLYGMVLSVTMIFVTLLTFVFFQNRILRPARIRAQANMRVNGQAIDR